jgi:hypothetical protein
LRGTAGREGGRLSGGAVAVREALRSNRAKDVGEIAGGSAMSSGGNPFEDIAAVCGQRMIAERKAGGRMRHLET